MKLKASYVVRRIGNDYFAVAVSSDAGTQKTLKLNETAAFLFEKCREDFTEETLTAALLAEYDVSPIQAKKDVEALIAVMKENELL